MRKTTRYIEIVCETCGNEYEYPFWKPKEITDRRTNKVVYGTVCPYCHRINEHKGKKK